MTEVYNWQLGREMDYVFEDAHPDWQFAFVFNINRCIACQTCTMACKSTWTFSEGQEHMWWNNVETKPYGGYPQAWDVKLLDLLARANPGGQRWQGEGGKADAPYGVFGGKTVFEADGAGLEGAERSTHVLGYLPTDEEWRHPNRHEEVAKGPVIPPDDWQSTAQLPEHRVWFFYLQRICNHCTYPACAAACPRKAIYKRPEDGVVLIDQERCRGYRKCVAACPYKKSLYRPTTRVSEKCIACYPRLEGRDGTVTPDGQPTETRCMSSCVGKIRLQGLVKKNGNAWADAPDNPLHFLIRERKIALPLYPQFGTEPNGYYIPPRWAPRPYLEQMFGPGVKDAIEQYCCPDRELLAVLQLFRATRTILFKYKIEKGDKVGEYEVTLPSGKKKTQVIYNDTIIGYDKSGKEAVRITVEEPTFERPDRHLNSI
ncbi:MAG: 4Fe-4S dicluster domain-containing protein [Planctomycetota bacterium]|jgi:nitrate reductase beta subunit|nr:nitrate oxidoreductase subunit beta [Candidatus Woesearchaeota archaeon]MDP6385027.1 4Fe-4S dicluster domain-containing protein [Planctomycetota bacterium]MDP6740697.1 4Fe-4S dicluster domain-containing protein [Planctomycetota bacterium]